MTTREFIERYLGWCPQFMKRSVLINLPGQLQPSSKIVVGLTILVWCFQTLIYGVVVSIQMMTPTGDLLSWILSYIPRLAEVVSSAFLVILLIDITMVHIITKYHRTIFTIILFAFSIKYLANTLLILCFPHPFFRWPLYVQLDFTFRLLKDFAPLLLFGYLTWRSAKKGGLITRKALLLCAVYAAVIVASIHETLFIIRPIQYPESTYTLGNAVDYIINTIPEIIIIIFSLSLYFKLGREPSFITSVPPWVRSAFLFYGLPRILNEGWVLYTYYTIQNFLSNSFAASQYILSFIFYIAIIACSFFPINLVIGEAAKDSNLN
jgi:hypothetical protein